MRADAVIDVEETARRALRLGRRITVFRYPGAIHAVFLSRRDVRQEAYRDLTAWLDSYVDSKVAPLPAPAVAGRGDAASTAPP